MQEGRGHRREPYVYVLPGMVEKWHQDFLATFQKRLESDAERNAPPPGPKARTRRGGGALRRG